MLGSITATATVGVNNPSVITITPSVTTFSSAKAVAYLGPQAIAPVVKYSPNYSADKYLDVLESGTPYDSSTPVSGYFGQSGEFTTGFLTLAVPLMYATNPSISHLFIIRKSYNPTISVPSFNVFGSATTNANLFTDCQFLSPNGNFISGNSVASLGAVNLKNATYTAASRGFSYYYTTNGLSSTDGFSDSAVFTIVETGGNYSMYAALALVPGQIGSSNLLYSALTAAYPFAVLSQSVATSGIYMGPCYAAGNLFGYPQIGPAVMQGDLDAFIGPKQNNGLVEARSATSQGLAAQLDLTYFRIGGPSLSLPGGTSPEITLSFEQTPDGHKRLVGGAAVVSNYIHQPQNASAKNSILTIDPARAYPGRRVQTIEIPSCGSQYVTAPSIMISEPEDENGTIAKATAEINNGKLSKITITDPGTGYSSAPDVFVLPPVSAMKYGAVRSVASVMTAMDRSLVLAMASGTTISENSWAVLDGLGNANGLAYVVTVATGGSQTTLKFPYDLGTVTSVGTATLTPLISYVRVTGAVISGTDANFAVGSTIPVTFSTPSCSDTDAVANFTVLNSGQIALSSIPTPGSATTFSVVTLSAYKKINGITVTCAGLGYWETAPTVTIDNAAYVPTAPGATPASISAILNGSGGIILTVTCAGYGYASAPTITIDAPNAGNGIRAVEVVTPGVGYSDGTFACTVSAAPAGGTTAVVNFVKSGTSQSFAIVNPGRGYTSVPGVVVTKPDLGGQISSFTVTCKGFGYLVAPAVTLAGGGGSGATAQATIDNGSITTISIITGGTGYTSAPAVTIDSPPLSVYYKKQIDLSSASVTTLLAGGSSVAAYLQIEEKSGTDTTVLAQIPITIQSRIS
jgi:hypothetical protein